MLKLKPKTTLSIVRKKPLAVILNPITNFSTLIGFFLALIANQFGKGYIIVFLAVLCIVAFGIVREANKFWVYQQKVIPLPIVINIANPASNENALESIFKIIEEESIYHGHAANLQKILGIDKQDLIFNYSGDLFDKDQLQSFLKIVRYNLEKLKQKTPRNTIIYLAYIGPASVGILVGTLFGTDGIRIFQYNKSSNGYYSVAEVIDRSFKEDLDINNFEKFSITPNPLNKTQSKACVVIDSASHKIDLQNPAIKNYGDIIHLVSKNKGTIQNDEKWLQYCREIYNVLNDAKYKGYTEIKLVYSMPVALGVLIGMATQQYWPILLTQYDQQTQSYRELFALNDFRYYQGQ